jgi:hypothetical protein
MPRTALLVVVAATAALAAAAGIDDGHGGPVGAVGALEAPRATLATASVAIVPARPQLPKRRRLVCPLAPESTALLPATARRGLAHHLRQYPAVALATSAQRRAAARLLARLRAEARGWRTELLATGAGFDTGRARRAPGDGSVHYLHAEHRLFSADRRFLDPTRPEALIFANAPGRPLVLVGLMFSMRRGIPGSTPGGPITRWHSHLVCVRGGKRGVKPRADGSCPAGAVRRQGSEMLHVWFTHDLRSAFAIHAPEPELCRAGLLPAATCSDPRAAHVM